MAAKNSKGRARKRICNRLGKCDILGDLATALKRWQGCCTHPCTHRSQETSAP
ncbi:hypothetical protein ZWY2020_004119 [Hordeum vulgare]|nr:hypothetical protein ZWY2020_004119 [Hordeum vulgare]